MEKKGQRNAYVCEKYLAHVVTENTFDLVTPFLIGCRVTAGCIGMMRSTFYPAKLQSTWGRDRFHTDLFWVPYTKEEIQAALDSGDQSEIDWVTGDHGKLVEEVS